MVIHHQAAVTYPESFASGTHVIERRRYGSTAVTFFGVNASATEPAGDGTRGDGADPEA